MLDNVLEDMNAVIIDGSNGIGLAIAQGLQEAGAAVAIVGRNQEKLEQAEASLRSRDAWARAFRVDVTDSGQFQETCLRMEQEFGSVDILVNSQGITDIRPAVEVMDADFAFLIATNLTSVFSARSLFRPRMIARGRGAIITITSLIAYRASRHGCRPLVPAGASYVTGAVNDVDGGYLTSCI